MANDPRQPQSLPTAQGPSAMEQIPMFGIDDPIMMMLQAIAEAASGRAGMGAPHGADPTNPISMMLQRPEPMRQGPSLYDPSMTAEPTAPKSAQQPSARGGFRGMMDTLGTIDPNLLPNIPAPAAVSPVKRPLGGALEMLPHAASLFLRTAATFSQAGRKEHERLEERGVALEGEKARTDASRASAEAARAGAKASEAGASEAVARTDAIRKEMETKDKEYAANVAAISAMTPEARVAVFGPGTEAVDAHDLARTMSYRAQMSTMEASRANISAIEETIRSSKETGSLNKANTIGELETRIRTAVKDLSAIQQDIAISKALAANKDNPNYQAILAANPLTMAGMSLPELEAEHTILRQSIDRMITQINRLDPSLAGRLTSTIAGATLTSGVSDDVMRQILSKANINISGPSTPAASSNEHGMMFNIGNTLGRFTGINEATDLLMGVLDTATSGVAGSTLDAEIKRITADQKNPTVARQLESIKQEFVKQGADPKNEAQLTQDAIETLAVRAMAYQSPLLSKYGRPGSEPPSGTKKRMSKIDAYPGADAEGEDFNPLDLIGLRQFWQWINGPGKSTPKR